MHKCKKIDIFTYKRNTVKSSLVTPALHCFFFRWRDLAESPVEPVALDNQSLGSGAEGPEEPDKPEDSFHNFCKFVVSATPSDK